MKINKFRFLSVVMLAILLPLLSSCFTILFIDQPTSVTVGDDIKVTMEVRTDTQDANPHYGILGVLVPLDWTVGNVEYSGDFGPDEMSYLHPDSSDKEPSGAVNYWNEALEDSFPAPEGMQWIVFQANTPFASELDTGYVDITIKMTVGNTPGTYNIGYMVTNAALEFTDPSYYDISLDNTIEVTGGTDVATQGSETLPDDYRLQQNYPNPFNPVTTIRFDLPVSGQTTLKVFDLMGREVATLIDGFTDAGSHQVQFDASDIVSGIYYVRLSSGNFHAMKKIALVR